jgi:hypothetical protein
MRQVGHMQPAGRVFETPNLSCLCLGVLWLCDDSTEKLLLKSGAMVGDMVSKIA